ncbi:Mitochondrial import inner membrane translocase subunit Tim22 [Tetrabaena socialis]|uniref:Mitochondrial import inner membrane translocase subunit Tim22 n=1 Tax=Tetrabaena socialis TaxID=47790 RepID=A0A2J7ZS52_9CHLO|nr:Mitochondrial import inner membrane translocase subunit Tim22 [Tetrabaena socialis]|eukprot:PNH03060.1 Mitochondrial import inner membrane translocase subunit Tim22 [Tetrabaena socialis]
MSSEEERADSSASASTSASPPAPSAPSPAPKKKKEWERISMPTAEEMTASEFMNNCAVKSALSCVMGGVAGLAFGLFTSSMENAHGGMDTMPDGSAQKSTRVVLKEMFSNMKTKSVRLRMLIEAGCLTDDTMRAGPQAMCIGCASFAAFSTAIEYWMDT